MSDRTFTAARLQHPSGVDVLRADGELDQHTAPELTRLVEEATFGPDNPVVIDLSGLTYCDSTGITTFVVAYNLARDTGAPFVLVGPNSDLMRVFRIVGLDQLFTFRPTLDSALDALAPAPEAGAPLPAGEIR
ncbi:anti-sigma B factor antagonist [Kitasatospora sp. SolWspMP-SS2h]|uniref:STAS domain-containing protein n=1 Tax=Kitasatospora sp. SolWspMP-SS2h TaxID=1305729 RepID=UPI000DBA1537|nr:STAS domain-containing protein [Kitasatospora sp. SolWspMP-SS2h]RAJ38383.1 anti-sigma B factor antagonist [Kitasatospora sp. SolWspMP-SS2h]